MSLNVPNASLSAVLSVEKSIMEDQLVINSWSGGKLMEKVKNYLINF